MDALISMLLTNIPSLLLVAALYFLIRNKLADSTTVNEQLRSANEDLRSDLTLLKSGSTELREEITQLSERLSGQKQESDQKLEAQQQLAEKLRTEVAELDTSFKTATKDVDEMYNKLDTLGDTVIALIEKFKDDNAQNRLLMEEIRTKLADHGLEVFVELRDVNYPGSTYTLLYDPAKDQLHGIYYQAVARQNYEVVFVRQ